MTFDDHGAVRLRYTRRCIARDDGAGIILARYHLIVLDITVVITALP